KTDKVLMAVACFGSRRWIEKSPPLKRRRAADKYLGRSNPVAPMLFRRKEGAWSTTEALSD
ncbi:MAG: hypothetical protein PHG46_04830, partial [Candidatus Omnitrophica bacterium]|nr:hypothetical protein [Candidatus Omnitrophota bacterium]